MAEPTPPSGRRYNKTDLRRGFVPRDPVIPVIAPAPITPEEEAALFDSLLPPAEPIQDASEIRPREEPRK